MKTYIQLVLQNSEGEYLLQMRDGTEGIKYPLEWDFFGGAIDETDASPAAAAARELAEELAVEAAPEEFELLGEMTQHDGALNHIFKYVKPIDWPLSVHEGAGAGFFTKEELLRINITTPTRQIVDTYLQ